jgi:hypothetical protein
VIDRTSLAEELLLGLLTLIFASLRKRPDPARTRETG